MRCADPLHDLEVCEGDSIDLSVTLDDLDPEVIWLHNGTVLRESMFISLTHDGFQRKLTVYPCTKQDEGVYACVLKELYNPQQDVSKLTVLTLCEVTVHDRRKLNVKEKALEALRTHQKLAWALGESVFEHVTLVLCIAAVIYSCCMYLCEELLKDDFPEVFEKSS